MASDPNAQRTLVGTPVRLPLPLLYIVVIPTDASGALSDLHQATVHEVVRLGSSQEEGAQHRPIGAIMIHLPLA